MIESTHNAHLTKPIPTRGRQNSRCRCYLGLLTSWLAFLPLLCSGSADAQSEWGRWAKEPVPKGAKVILETDSSEYLLGENVLVHFALVNTSNQPFQAEFGADCDGSDRPLRYIVTAIDEAGQEAEATFTGGHCMGGPGGPRILKPGEKFTESLALMRYCRIEKPGTYTIRVTHDFGWKEGERKRPAGEIKITFTMPSHAQAEQIVQKMMTLPDSPFIRKLGDRPAPYADFRCLRFPVYMDILIRMARDGDKRALEGLRYTPSVESTKAMLQLAGEPDQELALQCANILYERLPIPEAQYAPTIPGSTEPPRLSIRGQLVERTWDDSLAPEVRAVANKFLASENIPTIAAGALMMVSVGTIDDATNLIEAITRSRELTYFARQKLDDNILDFPQPVRELLRAMDALHKRGYSVGKDIGGDAKFLLYFHFFKDKSTTRPDEWLNYLNTFGGESWFPIREEAVRSIPIPMPDGCIDFVKARLEDHDLGVCRAACTVAEESGNPVFIGPLLEVVAAEHHDWLLTDASNAAQKLGAGLDLYTTWADRLHETGIYLLALDSLKSVLDFSSNSYSSQSDLKRHERLKLQEAWKSFLTQHAEEIRAGKRFKLTDPTVTPALAGRARVWYLPDGTAWPDQVTTASPQ